VTAADSTPQQRAARQTGCTYGDHGQVLVIEKPLRTERLSLRPFRDSDLDDALAYMSLPEVVRYLYWEVRDRDEVLEAVAARRTQDRLEREGDRLVLAVERTDDSRVIGEVNLAWASEAHQQGELGFLFHPDVHRRGYATEAATRVLDLAFDDLDLHRVYGCTDGRNDASAALMRRLGMRQEALFVHNEIFKGAWGDERVFAILADEWRTPGQGSARSNHRTSQ
jgi:RimJ/RimL family protein N-acetyltransferase